MSGTKFNTGCGDIDTTGKRVGNAFLLLFNNDPKRTIHSEAVFERDELIKNGTGWDIVNFSPLDE